MFAIYIKFLFSISLVANAGFFFPQIIKLYKTKDASGVSLITFLGFNAIQLISILYGHIMDDQILMYGFALSFVPCGLISILVLMYRSNKYAKS